MNSASTDFLLLETHYGLPQDSHELNAITRNIVSEKDIELLQYILKENGIKDFEIVYLPSCEGSYQDTIKIFIKEKGKSTIITVAIPIVIAFMYIKSNKKTAEQQIKSSEKIAETQIKSNEKIAEQNLKQQKKEFELKIYQEMRNMGLVCEDENLIGSMMELCEGKQFRKALSEKYKQLTGDERIQYETKVLKGKDNNNIYEQTLQREDFEQLANIEEDTQPDTIEYSQYTKEVYLTSPDINNKRKWIARGKDSDKEKIAFDFIDHEFLNKHQHTGISANDSELVKIQFVETNETKTGSFYGVKVLEFQGEEIDEQLTDKEIELILRMKGAVKKKENKKKENNQLTLFK